MTGAHVVVGLSGGVDSAVAALLLQRQGVAVEALFMKNWEEDDDDAYCAAEADLAVARGVAGRLDLPLRAVNFAHDYWERVFAHFLDEYRAGRTPNPDILCNREIKFRAFLDFALERGASGIATGHYARIDREAGRYRLLRGRDPGKDQSYFLYALDQQQLAHARFPVGDLPKSAVRELARDAGFANHDRKDSTGICFIGERRFKEFLMRFLPAQPGEIRDPDGELLGRHDGLMYYTLGQRHGLGIGGRRDAGDAPWYVVDKRVEENLLTVAQGHDHPLLFSDTVETGPLHWIGGAPPAHRFECTAKIRYRQLDRPCSVEVTDDGHGRVRFEALQRAVTPGQSVVLYAGEACLGGAIIERAMNSRNTLN